MLTATIHPLSPSRFFNDPTTFTFHLSIPLPPFLLTLSIFDQRKGPPIIFQLKQAQNVFFYFIGYYNTTNHKIVFVCNKFCVFFTHSLSLFLSPSALHSHTRTLLNVNHWTSNKCLCYIEGKLINFNRSWILPFPCAHTLFSLTHSLTLAHFAQIFFLPACLPACP
jgi:hypothetical protein